MLPVVRNINTHDFYTWDGKSFKNIRTGASGVVSDVAAQKTFRINVEATQILNEYPLVQEMISKLDLKMDISERSIGEK